MTRIFAIIVAFVLICACEAGLIENWIGQVYGEYNQRRGMPDALTDFLDVVYPKDDKETSIMKHIFMMFAEEGMSSWSNIMEGIEFVFQ